MESIYFYESIHWSKLILEHYFLVRSEIFIHFLTNKNNNENLILNVLAVVNEISEKFPDIEYKLKKKSTKSNSYRKEFKDQFPFILE